MNKQLITGYQLIFMMIMFLFGTSSILPTGVEAGSDIWAVLILATLYSVVLIFIYSSLIGSFPGKSLIEILPELLGKLMGKLIGLVFILFFFHLTSLVLRNLSDFMTNILPGTPISVFPITFLILATYAIKNGLEVIARFITWFFIITMGILVFNFSALAPELDFQNFTPIFSEGYKPIIKGFISASGFPFGEIIVFLMIIPYLNSFEFKKRKLNSVKAMLLFLVIFLIINIRNRGVLGALSEFTSYPSYQVIQYASVANVLENLGPFFMLAFIIGIFAKTVITFYAGVVGLAQWAGLKDYKSLLLPMSLIITTLSIAQFDNVNENVDFARRIYPLYIFPISFITPFFLLIVVKFKEMRTKN